jgi:hypothetical protein
MKNILSSIAVVAFLFLTSCSEPEKKETEVKPDEVSVGELTDLWTLDSKNNQIDYSVKAPHVDHIEFSGLMVAGIIRYGSDEDGQLVLKKKVVWPMLRTIPNDTHASLIHDFDETVNAKIKINGEEITQEKPYNISFNGILSITSKTDKNIDITRVLSPSTRKPAIVEYITLENKSDKDVKVTIPEVDYRYKTKKEESVYGVYTIKTYNDNFGVYTLKAGEQLSYAQVYMATKRGQNYSIDVLEELQNRGAFVKSLNESLVFESPEKNIDQMFAFAKLRATESIFATKGGLMHAPGGSRYYAAIWANDEAEYVNPFYPFLGNANGNESAINSFRHFARFMNDEFKPIPSSIVAEGDDFWNGAGDRGDAAMISYGASRFALEYGDVEVAKSLLPLIKWCITFSEKKITPEGVIASDSDELEGRFPAGKINLTTNMLAYSAYLSSADLLDAIGQETDLAKSYREKAAALREASEKYFGAKVQGFDTYRYYEGNDVLRSWICMPLTVGIFDRKEETLKALLSDYLWTKDGILTEAGSKTFWDRSTLYAFRGIFKAGETDTAMRYFKYYTQKHLLGDHVPYAVEAWPEGDQRHLSAESGLYARVIIEGLFGIEPTGFKSFKMKPVLPSSWDFMNLKHIKAFKSNFNIEVTRKGDAYKVVVTNQGKEVYNQNWDGKSEIVIDLGK